MAALGSSAPLGKRATCIAVETNWGLGRKGRYY